MKKLKFLSVFVATIMIFAIQGIAAPPDAKSPAKNFSMFKNYSAIHLAVAWDVSAYNADVPVQPQMMTSSSSSVTAKNSRTAATTNYLKIAQNSHYKASFTSRDIAVAQKQTAAVSQEDYIRDIATVNNDNLIASAITTHKHMTSATGGGLATDIAVNNSNNICKNQAGAI